ncbi:hypothetical protein C8J57DRAFT_1233171 [Mycena rebaudengoi]|nr:hypothetical protein C8J57DRAFT_1233171 [Mycena rebaudengoi]
METTQKRFYKAHQLSDYRLQLFIWKFEHATGASAPYFVHTEKENRKRRASQTTGRAVSLAASSTSKRIRTEVAVPLPLRSEFADLPGFSKVPFAFASVSIAEDGMDTPFDQGQTKLVHKIIVDGLPGVAKRFFNIGEGEGQVSIQENHDQVVQEVTRLSKAGYFLKRFFADAKRRGVDIEQAATVINEDGEGIQVLFDVMTHTLDGASGVGDHGKSGIDAFLAKHECVTRCTHLRLSRDGFTSEPASGSGDSDSD